MTIAAAAARRVTAVTVVVLFEAAVVASAPLTLALAAVASVAARSSRPVRTVAFAVTYAALELWTLAQVARGVTDWEALVRHVLTTGYAAMRRTLDVSVRLDAGSVTTDRLQSGNGVIVLARHCGTGDSLLIAWLLMVHHRLTTRIALKSALRWQPTLDLAASHLGFRFLSSRARSRDDIATLASSLRAGEALLLFPEGGNFSWPRWRDAIHRLAASGRHQEARRARRRTHTLPPHPGGVVAALQAAPAADVVLLAHSCFAADGRERPWWHLPVHEQLVTRTVLLPASDVPRGEHQIRGFLDDAWTRVDRWVEGQANLDLPSTRAAGGGR